MTAPQRLLERGGLFRLNTGTTVDFIIFIHISELYKKNFITD